jgi:hypothetical protein
MFCRLKYSAILPAWRCAFLHPTWIPLVFIRWLLFRIILRSKCLCRMLTYIYRTKTYIPSRIVDPSFLCSFKLSGPTPATDNYTRTCISKKGMMSEVVVLKSVKPPSRPKVDGHECPTLYSEPTHDCFVIGSRTDGLLEHHVIVQVGDDGIDPKSEPQCHQWWGIGMWQQIHWN